MRNTIGKVIISTIWTSDEGWETAIVDKNGAHPVERYGDIEGKVRDYNKAEDGHLKWCDFATTWRGHKKEITKLGGFSGLVANAIIFISF